MTNRAQTSILALTLLTHAALPVAAQSPQVIDRIVAAINHNYIVLASDVRRERAVMSALGEPEKNDREILEDLIGWRLLEEQMTQFPGIDVTDEELTATLKQKVSPLATSIPDVREAVRNRMRRAKYVDRRYGQFIRVTDDEKRKFYQDEFVPGAQKQGLNPIPSLDDPEFSALIQAKMLEIKLNKAVISDLEALRARSDVEIFQ